MEYNPDKIALWPGYFNSKISRSNAVEFQEIVQFLILILKDFFGLLEKQALLK